MKTILVIIATIFNFSASADVTWSHVPGRVEKDAAVKPQESGPYTIDCGYDGREGSFSTEYVFHIDLNGQSTYEDSYAPNPTLRDLTLVSRSQNEISFKSGDSILAFNLPTDLFDGSETEIQTTFESPYGNESLSCFAEK